MTLHRTFVGQLLRAYHGGEATCTELIERLGVDQASYLCEVGLGPIAFHTYGELLKTGDPDVYSLLKSADLTTRVIYQQMETAGVELLENLKGN